MPTQLTHSENKPTFTPAAEQKRVNKGETDTAVKEQPFIEGMLQKQSLTTTPGSLPPSGGSGQDDSSINHNLFNSLYIQPKLTVGRPDDIYEQKADRVTEQVMNMPELVAQRRPCKKIMRMSIP